MQRDHFPSTQVASMQALLTGGQEGRARLCSEVMQRYRAPLLAYVRGSSLRRSGDPEELVHAFFASRLSRADFFEQWLESGFPFRRWLMNGIHFCAHERRRAEGRAVGGEPAGDPAGERVHEDAGERAFERALAVRVIESCVHSVHQSLAARGLERHFTAFWKRYVDGRSYAAIASETGLSIRELNSAVRGVTAELRAAVRAELVREGVEAEMLEIELSRMEEVLRP
jgi:DNA-directed RNA polymerase specialized sigma24 family protein